MAHRQKRNRKSGPIQWNPRRFFYFGLALVLLANILPIPPWYTFIHPWRVEIAASIFLGVTLIYLAQNYENFSFQIKINPDEWRFIVLPLVAFILWSSLSAVWAPSWKSALHHSFIWAEYLIFYLIFRHVLERGASFSKLLTTFVLVLAAHAIPLIVEYSAYVSDGGDLTLGLRFAKYGEQVIVILPIVFLAVIRAREKSFVIGAIAIVLMWLLIFCSLGRINYILFGFAIASVFVGLLISKRHRRYVPKFALLSGLMILAPIFLHLFSGASPGTVVPVVARLNDPVSTRDSNSFRMLMLTVSNQMIRANPVTGVGADNFGMQFSRYRESYGSTHPTDVNLATAEDEIPGYAHNEFVQIVAELGLVGGGIVAWLLVGVGIMAFRAIREVRSGSLYGVAAILGLGMFLTSSLVSSYSFRLMQNGIVFFFVLAVAVKLSFKRHQPESESRSIVIAPDHLKHAFVTGIVVCIGLLIHSGLRVGSVIIAGRANQTKSLEKAMPLYETAVLLDDENPDARGNLGMRLFGSRRYKEAIPFLESAISIGRSPSAEFSYLATARSVTGDDDGAERIMASAVALYPRSPFVLTRFAAILEKNGKAAEAAAVFSTAMKIDERAARTWHALIVSGPKYAGDMAEQNSTYLPLGELRPQTAVSAIVTDRLVRFPEERQLSGPTRPARKD